MNLDDLIKQMTPEIYENLKLAIEIGKWADGTRLTNDQLENSLQAVIAYEQKHITEEHRVGYIDKGEKDGEQCDSPTEDIQTVTVRGSLSSKH